MYNLFLFNLQYNISMSKADVFYSCVKRGLCTPNSDILAIPEVLIFIIMEYVVELDLFEIKKYIKNKDLYIIRQ